MCAPCALTVFDGNTSVSRAEAGDFSADCFDDTDAFVSGRCWEVWVEGVFAFDGVDVGWVDGSLYVCLFVYSIEACE